MGWLKPLRLAVFILLLLAASSCGEARPTIIYSFADGQLSSDGSQLIIDAYPVSSSYCYEFLRADTTESGENLVVSLVYLAPTPNQFCELACPIGRENLVIDLDSPVEPTLQVLDDPNAQLTCTERFGH